MTRQPSLKSKKSSLVKQQPLGISQRLVMSATIKLYELAGAGALCQLIPSAGDRRSNCHLARSPADAFGGKPAKQWDTLVELDFEQIVQSPNYA